MTVPKNEKGQPLSKDDLVAIEKIKAVRRKVLDEALQERDFTALSLADRFPHDSQVLAWLLGRAVGDDETRSRIKTDAQLRTRLSKMGSKALTRYVRRAIQNTLRTLRIDATNEKEAEQFRHLAKELANQPERLAELEEISLQARLSRAKRDAERRAESFDSAIDIRALTWLFKALTTEGYHLEIVAGRKGRPAAKDGHILQFIRDGLDRGVKLMALYKEASDEFDKSERHIRRIWAAAKRPKGPPRVLKSAGH